MEPFSPVPQTVQGESEKADQVVYVEELGGEGDYWLSITDASRVCRVQDVSIRRAITRGALPVRRQRAGQNKRTRFVRASDLPQVGFPIIDESAAITTEIGKADILSIPRQQQRIVQDHQQLLTDLEEIRETIANQQTQMRVDLQQQKDDCQTALQDAQQEQTQQRAALELRLLQGQAQLQQMLIDTEQRLAQAQQTLQQNLTHAQEETLQREAQIHERVNAQQAEFAAYQQEVQRSLAELAATQQQSMHTYQQTVQEKFQQAEHEASVRLKACEHQLTTRLEKYATTFDTHLATLTEKLSLAQKFAEKLEQRMTSSNQATDHQLQHQQGQLEQHAQLLPLLPYAQQRLLTEQDKLEWTQALAHLEERVLAAQRQEQARYQPFLNLLSPARLEMLARLLENAGTQEDGVS